MFIFVADISLLSFFVSQGYGNKYNLIHKTTSTYAQSKNLTVKCTYNISGKHPENIIEEKSSQKDETGHDIVQMEKLDTVNSKCQTKQVICDPVLFQEIPDTNKGTENQCDQIMSCEFVFENFFVFNNTGTSKIGIEKGDF